MSGSEVPAATSDDVVRRSVTIAGRRVSYLWRDAGQRGPTLVLIHGAGVSARSWAEQFEDLARSGPVLALDLPGHGDSDAAPATSLAEYADVTARVLDALAAWPVVAVGHSLGGAVAAALATRRAESVRGLVLLSACARLPPVSATVQWLWACLPASLRWGFLFAAGASRRAIDLGMQELHACRARTTEADVAIARAMDLTALASALRVPTLILCGTGDRVTPPALSHQLHAMIAGSRLALVDGAGHMLPIEAPAVVNREIAGFVRSLAPGPTRAGAKAPARAPSRVRRALRRLVALVRGG